MTEDFREVTKAEFDEFLRTYPRTLARDVTGICEPPLVTYNDFTISPTWPDSIVARYGDTAMSAHPEFPIRYYVKAVQR